MSRKKKPNLSGLDREQVIQMLHSDTPQGRRAVERALLVLLDRQTADERSQETTTHRNSRGFTQADARMMTSLAKQVLSSGYPKGKQLSPRQRAWLLRPNKAGISRIAK